MDSTRILSYSLIKTYVEVREFPEASNGKTGIQNPHDLETFTKSQNEVPSISSLSLSGDYNYSYTMVIPILNYG